MFCEKISNLFDLTGEEIVSKLEKYSKCSNLREKKSWENSLPKLIKRVHNAGLDNLFILTEYELPAGGRIDAILLGDDKFGNHHALIIELKQWSKDGVEYYSNNIFPVIRVNANPPYPARHPVNQTKEYEEALKANHSNIVNGQLTTFTCQYLHDFELDAKKFFIQSEYANIDISKMFVNGEEDKLIEYLQSIFSSETDSEDAKNLFINGEYITTEMDMKIINKITESPDNIPLWHDQSRILDFIYPLLEKQAKGELYTKHMITITGAAGTGKTIVGFRILAEYWKLHPNRNNNYQCKYTLPKSRTIKMVLDGLSNDNNGIKPVFLDSINGHYDLLVIDEAHRITEFSNAIKSGQIIIVLQDDKQMVRANEIGTESNFKTFARRNGFKYAKFPLNYQKRSGLGSYVDRLDKLLYDKNYSNHSGLGLDVNIIDDIRDLETWMQECHHTSNSVKYYASYCWEWKSQRNPNAMDILIPEVNPVFSKQWNPKYEQYQWYLDSIDKVGCIYTAQGLGFDYIGFIWWDDLVWRTDHWEFHTEKVTRYDYQLKNSLRDNPNNEVLLLNIYRVMLTRAKKGLRIWFKDEETKQHFKEICLMEN
ncbi:DNA/RNA helicase domain-containing protein [uncultured Leptotrichia sp.]|uniref:DNA/RNA helicase domain-containing protein n=1 Tax=uncultured Leptotrichia sp. TaxID=159271 RepID=UPI0025EC160C|nr:DNA/RNA helicase domain-containing protein [uncultured Leptotrichia sp.]